MPAKSYGVERIGHHVTFGPFPVSFETNEQLTALPLAVQPFRFRVVALHSVVKKALGASDTGVITLKKGSTVLGSVTHTISAALNEEKNASNVDVGTVVETTDQMTLTSAKTTAGGSAYVTVTVEVLPAK